MSPRHGTYALVFKAKRTKRIIVGRLGTLNLRPGFYIYVGSAFGPGGLKARIGHHRESSSRRHWHIDYLSRISQVQGAWVSYGSQRLEHHWAEVLQGLPGARLPVAHFGSSDCHCEAHLTGFSKPPSLKIFMENADSQPCSVVQVR